MSSIKPKNLSPGDYISIKFQSRGDKEMESIKPIKGIIVQMTEHMLVINPDKPRYRDDKTAVSYADILTGRAEVTLLMSHLEIY